MSMREEIVRVYGDVVFLEPAYLDEAIVAVTDDSRVVYGEEMLVKVVEENEGVTYPDAVSHISVILESVEGKCGGIILETQEV